MPLPLPLRQRDLVDAGCDVPGCAHENHETPAELFLHAYCHPRGGLTVSYARADGVLYVSCKECAKLVVAYEVAP